MKAETYRALCAAGAVPVPGRPGTRPGCAATVVPPGRYPFDGPRLCANESSWRYGERGFCSKHAAALLVAKTARGRAAARVRQEDDRAVVEPVDDLDGRPRWIGACTRCPMRSNYTRTAGWARRAVYAHFRAAHP